MPYFDHNATTPLSPAARAAWLKAQDEAWQNPASPHRAGARVRALLEQSRAQLARILECAEERIVFTSGATESANATIAHAAHRAAKAGAGNAIALVNPTEHPCVLAAVELVFGKRVEFLPLNRAGVVDGAFVEARLRRGGVAVVAVMAANNETGVLQPWREIAAACRVAGVAYACDAAQWLGKLPSGGLGVADYVFGAAHKFGGPKGTGFAVVPAGGAGREFVSLVGGEQQSGRRAGTENFPDIAAMVAALSDAEGAKVLHESERLAWRERVERRLSSAFPEIRLVGNDPGAERLWNTVSAILPFAENHRWLTKLDKRGFQVSTGSACASGKETASHVLAALGLPPDEARRSLRFSSGWETTEAEWLDLAAALEAIAPEVRG